MIGLLSPFALRAAPFSRVRFVTFLMALAAILAVSILGERHAAGHDRDGQETVVRFPQPLAYTYGDLRQIGLPWFLRRLGATGRTDIVDASTLVVTMRYQGKAVGKYVERLVALGDDRSKLVLTFFPEDRRLVGELAAPVATRLDAVTLMRAVMAEHVRSSINGGGFDMRVLTDTPGSIVSVFRKVVGDGGLCQNPQSDDFRPCSDEDGAANIRRAYREEAERGGG